MTKIYKKPETEISEVDTHQIMAGSPGGITGGTTGQEYTGGDKTYSRQFEFLVEPEESTTVVTTNEEEWDEFEDEE